MKHITIFYVDHSVLKYAIYYGPVQQYHHNGTKLHQVIVSILLGFHY